jgi:ABC-type branched-subunit amino acid transport system substrate-binding protein
VTGLIGATISGVTLPVGTISSARKVPQISPSATASPLSNKEILHIVAVVFPQRVMQFDALIVKLRFSMFD